MVRCPGSIRRILCWLVRFLKQVCTFPKALLRVLWVLGRSRYTEHTYYKPERTYKPEHYTIYPSLAPTTPSPRPSSTASLLPHNLQAFHVPYAADNNASATNVSPSGLAQTSQSARPSRKDAESEHLTVPPGSRSQTPSQLNQAHWKIVPTLASDVMNKRYERKRHAKKTRKPIMVEAGSTWFDDDGKEGWTSYVHPEGALYFVRLGDIQNGIHTIFTNTNIRDPKAKLDVCSELGKASEQILEQAAFKGVPIGATFELVLECNPKNQSIGYYFADHQGRCLVWAEDFKDTNFRIAEHIRGVENKGHIKHAMEAQYWAHCEAYPHGRQLTESMFNGLTDMVLHAIAERVTTDTSLAPYDADELDKIQGVLDSMKDRVGQKSPHGVCTVARFMRMFARSRFYNFCGQPEARLDADTSVYRPTKHSKDNAHPPRSKLFLLLAIPMLGMPPSQLYRLEAVWVDRSVNTARWKEYLQNSYDEFTGFALYSTVMLAVDVSYLAVPGVEQGSQGSENAATVFTYVSIIAVVGSMTLSLLLSADARRRKAQSAETAAALLSTVNDSLFGIETLAVMYSLPLVLLMWGMAGFFGGLCSRIFPGAALYTICICAIAIGVLGLAVWIPLYTWWRVEHGTPTMFKWLIRAIYVLRCGPCRQRKAAKNPMKARKQHDVERDGADAGQAQGSGYGQARGQGGNHELQDLSQQPQTQAHASQSQGQASSEATMPMAVTPP